MGRRLNLSTPTVINTELVPLDDSFWIENDGQLEQWYYDNTQTYAPNRSITPLTLTPMISASDKDSMTEYVPTLNLTRWYETSWYSSLSTMYDYAISHYNKSDSVDMPPSDISSWAENPPTPTQAKPYLWARRRQQSGITLLNTKYFVTTEAIQNSSGSGYAEMEITNQTDGDSAVYVKQGNNLIVKKNVSYSRSVTLRCFAQYIDPRDAGIVYAVEASVTLTTNRDADVIFPEVAITSPSSRSFNPLIDYDIVGGEIVQKSEFAFEAVVTNNPSASDVGNTKYKVDGWGTEQILPENTNGIITCAPDITIEYPDGDVEENANFFLRPSANGTKISLLPSTNEYMKGIANVRQIKGNTLQWNQMVQNGDFKNGTSGWNAISVSSISAQDGGLLLTATSANMNVRVQQTIADVVIGHKYYICCMATASRDTTRTRLAIGSSISNSVGVNSSLTQGQKTKICAIVSPNTVWHNVMVYLDATTTPAVGDTLLIDNVMCIDLSAIYGDGNEPNETSAFEADFESWYGHPLVYEDYNEGELISVRCTNLKTVGFNQFDSSTLKLGKFRTQGGSESSGSASANRRCSDEYFPCLPNTTYRIHCDFESSSSFKAVICFYDSQKEFISGDNMPSGSSTARNITTPSNAAYFRMSSVSPSGTIYVQLRPNSSRDSDMEDYWFNEAKMDVTEVKGKEISGSTSVTVFPDGMKRIGSVFDEIVVSGGVLKAIQRIGSRSYSSTDINSATILTDGNSTTYYVLPTENEYILNPMQDFGNFVWYGIDAQNREVLANTLPWYKSGQNTSRLVVDAMYGESINVILRAKTNAFSTDLSPSKSYASVEWRVQDVDTHVVSENGSAVRSTTSQMTFGTICNTNGIVLSDAVKNEHLRFNWKYRYNNLSTEVDQGWGATKSIPATLLRHVKGNGSTLASTLVFPYVYLLGAWEVKTSSDVVAYQQPEKIVNGITYVRSIPQSLIF